MKSIFVAMELFHFAFLLEGVCCVTCVAQSNLPAGSIDPTYSPASFTPARLFVQSLIALDDDQSIVGGYYASDAPTPSGGFPVPVVARLKADGALETILDVGPPPWASSVRRLALDPAGRLISAGGSWSNSLVRFTPEGQLDASFRPTVLDGPGYGSVRSLAMQPDGKILIAGSFDQVNGDRRRFVARLSSDGSTDRSFRVFIDVHLESNEVVEEIAVQRDGKILVAGNFTSVQGEGRNGIARLNADGTLDYTFDPGSGFRADAVPDLADRAMVFIYALALSPDQKIYVAGSFQIFDGAVRPHLVRLNADGSLDRSFHLVDLDALPGAGPEITSLVVQPNGKVLLAGNFTALAGVGRNRVARLEANGDLDLEFNPPTQSNGFYTWFSALALQPDGNVLVGGSFDQIGGASRPGIVRLIGGDPPLPVSRAPRILGDPVGQSIDQGASVNLTVFAAGEQPLAFQWQFNGAELPGATNSALVITNAQPVNSGRYRVLVQNSLGSAQSSEAVLVVDPPGAPPGTTDPEYHEPVADGPILQLLSDPDGKAFLAGSFTHLNGTARTALARLEFDGSVAQDFVPALIKNDTGAPATVRAVAPLRNGRIYIEGAFTKVGGQPRNMLARLLADGRLDESFRPAVTNSSGWFALQADGKILTGMPVVRLRLDGTVDPTWQAFSGAFSLGTPRVQGSVQGDGRVLLALDYGMSTFPRQPSGIGIIRLKTDGTPDPSYQGPSGPPSSAFPIPPRLEADGKMLFFSTGSLFIHGMNLSRFHRTGQLDGLFRAGLEPLYPSCLAPQDQGRLIVGGDFVQVDGQPREGIARLLYDGTLDLTFVSQAHWQNGPSAVAVQPDGDVLAAGPFQDTGTAIRWKVVRLTGDRRGLAPVIVKQPLAETVFAGRPAGLFVEALGFPMPQFQWQVNGTTVPGATNAWLTWPLIQLEQTGDYSVTVSNRFGQVRSANVLLNVLLPSPPAIVSHPSDQAMNEGTMASFSVTATNLLDIFYQWRFNGMPLTSATNATLVLTNVLQAQAGTYSVVVSNVVGAVTSNPARLSVYPAAQSPGQVDPTFYAKSVPAAPSLWSPGFNGTSVAVDQAGRIYLNVDRQVARLHADGTQDLGFNTTLAVRGGPSTRGGLGVWIDFTSLDALALQSDQKVLIRGAFTEVGGDAHNQIARLMQDGSLDPSFQADPGTVEYSISFGLVGNRVRQIRELSNGDIIIAGEIRDVNGQPRLGIAKLLATGALDSVFDPSSVLGRFGWPNLSRITAVAEIQGNRLLVAGGFVNPFCTRVFQLNADGTLDTRFKPVLINDASSSVNVLSVQPDGKILVGGAFAGFSGSSESQLVRMNPDGTIDASFRSGLDTNSPVTDLALQGDGRIIVIGDFTTLQGVPRNQIARLNANGSLDKSFDPGSGPDGKINSVALQADGHVVIGGSFTNVNGVLRRRVARLFGGELPGPPVIQVQSQSATVFTGQQVKLEVLASSFVAPNYQWQFNGSDLAGATNATLSISSMQPSQAGRYTVVVTNPRGSATSAAIDLNVTAPVPPVIVQQPSSLAAYAGQTVFFSVTAESSLPLSFQWGHNGDDLPGATNTVLRLDDIGGADAGNYTVLVTHALGSTVSQAAVLTVDLSLTTGLPDLTFDLSSLPIKLDPTSPGMAAAVDSQGRILVAGRFINAQGNLTATLVRLTDDGTLDSTFNMLPGDWNHIAADLHILADGKILYANPLMRLNSDGNPDPAFVVPPLNGATRNLAVQADGNLIVAGSFSSVDGQPRDGLARLSPSGQLDVGFKPLYRSAPDELAMPLPSIALVQPDQQILAWFAWNDPGADSAFLTDIRRLNPDGTDDPSFNLGVKLLRWDEVRGLALQSDGRIILAQRYGGEGQTNFVVRLTPAGSLDPTFHSPALEGPDVGRQLTSILVQPDDKILIAGNFLKVNGVPRCNISRLNADGTVDATFNPGSGADGFIWAIALAPNNDVIVVGSFTSFNGLPRPGIVRLHGSDAAAPGPYLARIGWSSGVFRFEVQTEPGRVYVPEFKDPAGTGAWQTLPSLTGDGRRHSVSDPYPSSGSRIYRVRVNSPSQSPRDPITRPQNGSSVF